MTCVYSNKVLITVVTPSTATTFTPKPMTAPISSSTPTPTHLTRPTLVNQSRETKASAVSLPISHTPTPAKASILGNIPWWAWAGLGVSVLLMSKERTKEVK